MANLNISIFGNKILLEILREIKLFSKFKIKSYEDLDLCIKDAEKQNPLVVFFITEETKYLFNNKKMYSFPSMLVGKSSTIKGMSFNGVPKVTSPKDIPGILHAVVKYCTLGN